MQRVPTTAKDKSKIADSPNKQSPKPTQTLADVPEIAHDPREEWTIEKILQLQRTIGNQATRRLINLENNTRQATVIQRRETGMRGGAVLKRYSKDALKVMTDHPTMAPNAFVTEIHKLATAELKATGAPATILAFGGSGAGSFSEGTWTLQVNSASVFETNLTVGTADQVKVDDLVNTMYHETRHAEQAWRILRMRAGKIIPKGSSSPDYPGTATQLVTATGVPANVALAAAKKPLYASWGSVNLGQQDKMMEEAEAWDKNFFGVDKDYDALMQSGFDDVTAPLMKDAKALFALKARVLGYGALTNVEKGLIRADLPGKSTAFKNRVTALDGLMTGDAKTEFDRLKAIDVGDRTANDTLMLGYMTEIFRLYALIETKFTEFKAAATGRVWATYFARVTSIDSHTDSIDDQVILGYKNLPEEKDAFAAGDTAEAKLKEERAK
jgi:hypothetical protein